jgi:PIN domain nuclease of toxin-antitoxin system
MLQDSLSLSKGARELLSAPETEVYCSSVSIAEISIKHKIHPEEMDLSGGEVSEVIPELGCMTLDFEAKHAATLDNLPLHHRDPFDRMLLAQAKAEGMKLLSHDNRFPAYGDFIITI